jgi:RimJ/RimL family protein N-acetyltransferase
MPELETPRLRLRMFTADDLDDYHQGIYGDADVMRYQPPETA